VITLLFAVYGGLAIASDGFPARFSGEARLLMNARDDFWKRRDECDGKICRVGVSSAQESFILWGDSHAGALAPVFERLALDDNLAGAVAFQSACAPLLQLKRYGTRAKDCTEYENSVLEYIKAHHIKTVFLHGRWGLYVESARPEQGSPVMLSPSLRPEENYAVFAQLVHSTLKQLHDLDLHVVIIASVPEVGTDVPTALARVSMSEKPMEVAPRYDQFMKRQGRAFEVLHSAADEYSDQIVYPHETLCDTSECSVMKEKWPLYSDDDHLSVHGAMYLTPMFQGLLKAESSGSRIAKSVPNR
jgi:hypothetical protein